MVLELKCAGRLRIDMIPEQSEVIISSRSLVQVAPQKRQEATWCFQQCFHHATLKLHIFERNGADVEGLRVYGTFKAAVGLATVQWIEARVAGGRGEAWLPDGFACAKTRISRSNPARLDHGPLGIVIPYDHLACQALKESSATHAPERTLAGTCWRASALGPASLGME